jgi:hypothetical protein
VQAAVAAAACRVLRRALPRRARSALSLSTGLAPARRPDLRLWTESVRPVSASATTPAAARLAQRSAQPQARAAATQAQMLSG